ncbi:hypothetical protein QTP86_009263 [Hemibagrus guttatus]|nr:hypothetical protein QTP86_009263 [Hemibagrus guttatus]
MNTVVKKAPQRLYDLRCLRDFRLPSKQAVLARKIVKDLSHPNNGLFSVLQSGKRFRSLKANTERLRRSFYMDS